MLSTTNVLGRAGDVVSAAVRCYPGVISSVGVALAAMLLAERLGISVMILALLLGMAFVFLGTNETCEPGITFSAKTLLRVGVVLLGARVDISLFQELGLATVLLMAFNIVVTMGLGLLLGLILGRSWHFGLLTGGSVAICGASAAMALSSVLPRTEYSDRNLAFTVLGVTLLSTVAMVAYPLLVELIGLDRIQSAIFIGGSIHDIAQVVGAGYSISDEVGTAATTVKLIRVAMLVPVVLIMSLATQLLLPGEGKGRIPRVPAFIGGFALLCAANSLGLVPTALQSLAATLSGWAMVTAIAATGMRMSLRAMASVGPTAIVLILVETIVLALILLAAIPGLR